MTDIDPIFAKALETLVPYLVGTLSTLLITVVAFHLNAKKDERGQAIEAYRKLMALRITPAQLMVTRYEAIMNSLYHRGIVDIKGLDEDSWDFRRAERYHQKAEDDILPITKVREDLGDVCALLSIYFKSDTEIQTAIDKVLIFETFKVNNFTETDPDLLAIVKDQAVVELQDLADRTYTDPIDAVIALVKPKLFTSRTRRLLSVLFEIPKA
jgi:hypothetical protein